MSLTSRIQALIDFANETTDAGDTLLGDAVKTLADGYHGGGSSSSSFPALTGDSLPAKLSALLAYANGVTGAGDVRLGDAIRTLCEGWGSMDERLSWIASGRKNWVNTEYSVEVNDTIILEYIGQNKVSSSSDECQSYFGAGYASARIYFRLAARTVGLGNEIVRRSSGNTYAKLVNMATNVVNVFTMSPVGVTNELKDNTQSGIISGSINSAYIFPEERPFALYNILVDGSVSQDKKERVKVCRFTALRDNLPVIDLIPVLHEGVPCFRNEVDGTYRMFTIETPDYEILYE